MAFYGVQGCIRPVAFFRDHASSRLFIVPNSQVDVMATLKAASEARSSPARCGSWPVPSCIPSVIWKSIPGREPMTYQQVDFFCGTGGSSQGATAARVASWCHPDAVLARLSWGGCGNDAVVLIMTATSDAPRCWEGRPHACGSVRQAPSSFRTPHRVFVMLT